jgi:hypothetical protein
MSGLLASMIDGLLVGAGVRPGGHGLESDLGSH